MKTGDSDKVSPQRIAITGDATTGLGICVCAGDRLPGYLVEFGDTGEEVAGP